MIFPYIEGEPIVYLEIKAKDGNWYNIPAYVDSGAAYSVFHVDYAEALGINFRTGREISLTIGDGSEIPTFIHKLPVRFAGKEFIAKVSFSPSLGIGANIIGMRSFFDNFQICFNNKRKIVEIKPL